MVLTESTMSALGTSAPDFALPEPASNREWTLADFGAEALVVVFTCNHCPYAQAVEERVIALARGFAGRADFVAISANDVEDFPDDAPAKMAQRAREKQYPFPYLYDESQAIARAYGAACTPDFFLYDADRKLAYRGRLDDNWQEPERVEREELRDAIEALLASEPVAEPQLPALGCNIKWRA
uniref:Alkyl hydroperoxide reductase/ thiol specific antioxidant/ Mal allergen n=1 Tax=uncultured marine group II/III euryarchaeote KM3_141_A08 TaxID=1457875 RepID=A0A075GBQ5_9EURY|nr:alkyl hydroperoxide reductase/ thiol specific antioxidant/ Mal allergen [uncultured marine group II/III euryarchaeote KM3_141_A08]